MAKSEMEDMTNTAIKNGGILARLYFDMQSEKPDDLQPLLADLINNNILKAPGVMYCYGSIDEPIKLEDMYSTNAATIVLFKDLAALINVSFAYAPAGIEVLKPEKEVVLKPSEIQSIALDVANVSTQYSQYILSKALSKEDFEKIQRNIKSREELGKKLIENGKKRHGTDSPQE